MLEEATKEADMKPNSISVDLSLDLDSFADQLEKAGRALVEVANQLESAGRALAEGSRKMRGGREDSDGWRRIPCQSCGEVIRYANMESLAGTYCPHCSARQRGAEA